MFNQLYIKFIIAFSIVLSFSYSQDVYLTLDGSNLNYESTKLIVEACDFYGIDRLVFASSCSVYGASDKKSGGVECGPKIFTHPQIHHKPQIIGGINKEICSEIIQNFFKLRR